MADLTHVHANQIHRRHVLARMVAWCAATGVVTGFATGLWPIGALCGVFWLAAYRVLVVNQHKWRSGWEGERRALKSLRQLPDDCAVLNQVRVPCQRSATGWLEADFVVVSPRGVVLIEVKNHRGHIRIDADGNWQIESANGVSRSMGNAAHQALRQAAQIGGWLRAHGTMTWISPVVCATRANVAVSNRSGCDGVLITQVEGLLLALSDPGLYRRRMALDREARTVVVVALVRMDREARHMTTPTKRPIRTAKIST